MITKIDDTLNKLDIESYSGKNPKQRTPNCKGKQSRGISYIGLNFSTKSSAKVNENFDFCFSTCRILISMTNA